MLRRRSVLIWGCLGLSFPLQAGEILSNPEEQEQYRQEQARLAEMSNIHLYLNRAQRQLQVRKPNGEVLRTYPVAVGRPGWLTPKGEFKILKKITNPTWEHIFTQERFPSGFPGNPLGPYYLGFHIQGKNEFGMHGTNQPDSIGKAISHGCVRLHNADIRELFDLVQVGTPLTVY